MLRMLRRSSVPISSPPPDLCVVGGTINIQLDGAEVEQIRVRPDLVELLEIQLQHCRPRLALHPVLVENRMRIATKTLCESGIFADVPQQLVQVVQPVLLHSSFGAVLRRYFAPEWIGWLSAPFPTSTDLSQFLHRVEQWSQLRDKCRQKNSVFPRIFCTFFRSSGDTARPDLPNILGIFLPQRGGDVPLELRTHPDQRARTCSDICRQNSA